MWLILTFWSTFSQQTKDELWGPVKMINNVGLFVGMPLIAEEVTATLYCMCDRVEKSVAKNLCQNCLLVH